MIFSASGRFGSGALQSSAGYYWSATREPSNTSYAYDLTFTSTQVIPASNTTKTARFSVRCIRPA